MTARNPQRRTLRRVAAATTAMTAALISLGVYTAATGSGLACAAQWPLCSDQFVPALTINPDFIEWFHRVWAMLTGFAILGTAALAWRAGGRRTRLAATLAVVLLPLQITVGAVTVTLGGLIEGGYTLTTHAAHLTVALTIFTALSATALLAGPPGGPSAVRRAAGGAVGLLAAGALVSRAVPLVTYSPGAQAWYYLLSLAAYAGLLAAAYWAAAAGRRRVAAAAGGALAAQLAAMLLGRDLLAYTPAVRSANLALVAASLALAGVAALLAGRGGRRPAGGRAARGD